MANQDHIELLKQGVKQWNQWREQHQEISPDLSEANLSEANLSDVDLSEANLSGADLRHADLSEADLIEADLRHADLSGANLSHADLSGANLSDINLHRADLRRANLSDTDLSGAKLKQADLRGADAGYANLSEADLSEADLSGTILYDTNLRNAHMDGTNLQKAKVWDTIFARINLSATKGITEIVHSGRSIVELATIQLPQDGSALHFLRGTGVSDEWIADYQSRMMSPIQYHSCFISYSNQDAPLARRLHADLQAQGVRCWFAPEDMKIGDKIRSRIDEAIHRQEKLLLLLSEHALASDWVEVEVETALDKEKNQKREVLFPVRLDESIMQTSQAWARQLRRVRHIGDFTRWADSQAYQQAFERLLRDLKKATSEQGRSEPGPPTM